MAVVRVCDRCKKFYQHEEPVLNHYAVHEIRVYANDVKLANPIDLCPKCTDELSRFMVPNKKVKCE